jgi:hypothetical protein
MTIDSSGNVKINNGNLELGSEGISSGYVYSQESLYFNVDSNNTPESSVIVFGTGRTGNTGGSELMRIDSSGNVGIGESDPNKYVFNSKELHIKGGTGTNEGASVTVSSGQGANGFIGGYFWRNESATDEIQKRVAQITVDADTGGADTSRFEFYTKNGVGDYSERMRITSGGDLLVGTTSDFGGKVNIGGDNDAIITRGATSTNSGNWIMQRADTGASVWRISTNASNFYIADADFSHYAFLSQNPTSWSFGSDERLKEDVVDIDYGLSTILNLKPRRFTFKSSQKNSIGFIAQELKPIIPEAVTGEEKEILDTDTNEDIAKKILGVSADTLVPVLVKAMQEQQEVINELKARIETLENN